MSAVPKQSTDNPFQSPVVAARQADALVAVEQSRAIAETQAAMVIAKKFPRDPMAAMDRILNACTRPTLAEQALYTYARGGTEITGPSIRLAEALAQQWGNFQFGIRELEQRQGESTVEAFAWDVETNTRQVKTFQVKHERHTKRETYALTDPRDIYELTANQGARRLRACILGVIPGDVVEAAVKQCETTLKTKAEVTPERLASLLEKFAEFGVTKDQIERRIQRHLDAMTPAQMVDLGKKYNSLKDGMSTVADWFEVAPGGAEGDGAAAEKPSAGAELRRAAARAAGKAQKPSSAHDTAGDVEERAPLAGGARAMDEAKTLVEIDTAADSEIAALVLDEARSAKVAWLANAEAAFKARWVKARE